MDASQHEPAGGYGGGPGPVSNPYGPTAPEDPPPRRLAPVATVLVMLVTLSSVLLLVVVGCRRYIAVAKTAEVRNNVHDIGVDAASTYEAERRVCPSSSRPVPAEASAISGRKYQSSKNDWTVDAETHAGFSCLGYEYDALQYFQYSYDATPAAFAAHGRGDLDGNGVFSEFAWSGHVESGHMVMATKLFERDIGE